MIERSENVRRHSRARRRAGGRLMQARKERRRAAAPDPRSSAAARVELLPVLLPSSAEPTGRVLRDLVRGPQNSIDRSRRPSQRALQRVRRSDELRRRHVEVLRRGPETFEYDHRMTYREIISAVSRDVVLGRLRLYDGDGKAAARSLALPHSTFYRRWAKARRD